MSAPTPAPGRHHECPGAAPHASDARDGPPTERHPPPGEPVSPDVRPDARSLRLGAALRDLAYLGADAHYGIGLEGLVPGYRMVVGQQTPAADLLRAAGTPVLVPGLAAADDAEAAGSDGSAAPARGSRALLSSPEVVAALESRAPVRAFVFKSAHAMERAFRERGWTLLAAPAKVARVWENKVAFRARAEALGLRQPAGIVLRPDAADYAALAAQLGPRFVLQGAYGYAGRSSWPVANADELAAARAALRAPRARAVAWVEGRSRTLNGCVTARGVAVGAPFAQITGHPELTRQALGSCGQSFDAATAAEPAAAEMRAVAIRLGEAMAEEGLRGWFGVDFVVDHAERPWLIEVNPRLVASASVVTQLERLAGRVPLLLRHLLALGAPEEDDLPLDLNAPPLRGGQLVIHQIGAKAMRLRAPVLSGAYALTSDASGRPRPRLLRPAFRLDQVAPDELLVLPASSGQVLETDAAWCRVQARAPLLEGEEIRPDALALARALQRELVAAEDGA